MCNIPSLKGFTIKGVNFQAKITARKIERVLLILILYFGDIRGSLQITRAGSLVALLF